MSTNLQDVASMPSKANFGGGSGQRPVPGMATPSGDAAKTSIGTAVYGGSATSRQKRSSIRRSTTARLAARRQRRRTADAMRSAVPSAPLWHGGGPGSTVFVAGALGSGHRAVSRPWPASQSSGGAMPFHGYNLH